ncbi:ATP-binding protein [Micromonospora zhanjiangensis]
METAEPNRFAVRLPAEPTRLSVLRRRLDDFLVANRVGEADRFDLTVAVSEAAANAIEHPVAPTGPTIVVEASIDDGVVTATIRDSGQWREATEAGFRGRGLALIRAVAEVSVDRTAEGTAVTLRRRLR